MSAAHDYKSEPLPESVIEDALFFVDPHDRATWVRMGMALKMELGEAGFHMWDKWSSQAKSYTKNSAQQVWKSLKLGARGGTPVNIGTLIWEAEQQGFDLRKAMTADDVQRLSDNQAAKRRADAAKAAAESERQQREARGAAARLSNELWNEAEPVEGRAHPYLRRKNVGAHGLRVGRWPLFKKDSREVYRWLENVLLVPISGKDGKITSLQGIFARKPEGWDTDRSYMKDGDKAGKWHMIGAPKAGASIVVCEGYATGATIHEATGWCVVVAFDAGSLLTVAETLSEALPGHPFIIAGDNDRWSRAGKIENPGRHFATEAGRVINARSVLPQFTDEQVAAWREANGKGEDAGPTDFNDLAALAGAAEVVTQLCPAIPMAANDAEEPTADLPVVADPVDPRDVDVFNLPDVGGKGKVLSTIENLREILTRLRVTVRYNVISKEEEYLIPGQGFTVDNAANASLAWLESWCARFRMSTDKLGSFLTYLADCNLYNPAAAWITSRPWDGVDRLPDMFATVTPVEDKLLPDGRSLKDVLILRWMVSAVAAAFSPSGIEAQGALVLQGPQDLGKTKWLLSLVPPESDLAREGVTLKLDDKDSIKQAVSHWLVELGELDGTFRKSDVANLKAFITRGKDTLRRAYAKKDSNYARRTVFFGSVNPKQFLIDTTGNRRFWTVECAAVNWQHGLDMQQVWAQVHALWEAGERFHLEGDEKRALNESNEEFQVADPVEERLQTRLEWKADRLNWGWRTATDVLLSIGMDRPTQSDVTKAAGFLRKQEGVQAKRSNGKNLLLIPPAVRASAD